MPEVFDPYLKWLGIPPKHQPPNHYRLLGLEPLEDDPDAIESAADRQMAHVRTFSTGKRMELAEGLLKELAEARVALLNPEKKAAYDKKLRASLRKKKQAQPPAKESPPKAPPPLKVASPADNAKAAPPAPKPKAVVAAAAAAPHAPVQPAAPMVSAPRRSGGGRRRNNSTLVMLSIVGAGGLLLCVLAALVAPGLLAPPDVAAGNNPAPIDPAISPTANQGEVDQHDAAVDSQINNGESTTNPNDETPPEVEPPRVEPSPEPTDPDDGSGSNPPTDTGEEPLPPEEPLDNGDPPTEENGSQIATQPTRPKPPARDKQIEIQARIRQLYPVSTTATPRDNMKLAQKLIEDAAQTLDNNDDRYTMLSMAADLAVDAADLKTASQAIDEIEKHYDADAASMRLDAVQRAAKVALPESKAEVIRSSLAVLDRVMQQSRYQDAEKTAIVLLGLARRLGDRDLNKALIDRRQTAKTLGDMYEQAVAGIATLTKDPENAAANTVVGSFWIFAKGNWEKGLPHLAKGDDAKLADIARLELESPEEALDQSDLGDHWFHRSKHEEPLAKEIMLRRAKHWYERSQDGVTGLAKANVEQRLEEIAAALTPTDADAPIEPTRHAAKFFVAAEGGFAVYVNGEPLASAASLGNRLITTECMLKSGDILTARCTGFRGRNGFAAVLKFEQGDVIVTGQANAWRTFTPVDPTRWIDARGITKLGSPTGSTGDRHNAVSTASGAACASIWNGRGSTAYFVLQIP